MDFTTLTFNRDYQMGSDVEGEKDVWRIFVESPELKNFMCKEDYF